MYSTLVYECTVILYKNLMQIHIQEGENVHKGLVHKQECLRLMLKKAEGPHSSKFLKFQYPLLPGFQGQASCKITSNFIVCIIIL